MLIKTGETKKNSFSKNEYFSQYKLPISRRFVCFFLLFCFAVAYFSFLAAFSRETNEMIFSSTKYHFFWSFYKIDLFILIICKYTFIACDFPICIVSLHVMESRKSQIIFRQFHMMVFIFRIIHSMNSPRLPQGVNSNILIIALTPITHQVNVHFSAYF